MSLFNKKEQSHADNINGMLKQIQEKCDASIKTGIELNLEQADKTLKVNLKTKNSEDLKEVTNLLSNLGRLKQVEVENITVEVPKIIEKEVIKEIEKPIIVTTEKLVPIKMNDDERVMQIKNILDNSATNKDAISKIRDFLDYPYKGGY